MYCRLTQSCHTRISPTPRAKTHHIALVIDAMDLLHSGRFDGFCLVSSDSDFTRLAARIREQGVDVYGFGEQKTPESFRRACRRFVYTENLLPEAQQSGRRESEAGRGSVIKAPSAAAHPRALAASSGRGCRSRVLHYRAHECPLSPSARRLRRRSSLGLPIVTELEPPLSSPQMES